MLSRRQLLQLGLFASGGAALCSIGCTVSTPAPTPCLTASLSPPEPPQNRNPGLLDTDIDLLQSQTHPLPIVQRVAGESSVLRRRARSVTDEDQEHLELFERRMHESLQNTGSGVGLAGPQIAISARAILVMLGARSESPEVQFFINPRIFERSDDITLDYEGCLSIPGLCGLVKRNRRIVVEHGLLGRRVRVEASDFDARIFQHEIDHLDGVLYIDRVDGETHPADRLKELRQRLREQQPKVACTPNIRGRYRDEVLL